MTTTPATSNDTKQAPTRKKGPASHLTHRMSEYRVEAAALKTVMGLFRFAGLERAQAAGGFLARTVGPRLGVSKRARRNLTAVMPELPAEEVERIVKGVWDGIGRTAAEYAHLDKFDYLREGARVDIVGMDIVEEIVANSHGGIFFSGHFGNWELQAKAPVAAGLPSAAVVRPANNPLVDEWLEWVRHERLGIQTIAKHSGAARGIVQALKQGKYIAMLIDQKVNEGIPVEFFGRPAMTTPVPARLAMKLGCPLIPAWIERTGPARYRLHVYRPIEMADTGDSDADVLTITRRMNAFLEERIREKPENWLWLHNRWGSAPKG